MRERRPATISDLRAAIDCLPRATRVAMLEGIESNEIIAGAYSDSGGICPMLAAHRAGGRTDFIGFAKAWDRFAFRGASAKAARRATARELLILRTHLEGSLLADEHPAPDLAGAVAEHRRLVAERERALPPRAEPQSDDRDRSGELRSSPGWAWMRIVRGYDDYRNVLRRLTAEQTPEPIGASSGND
jgi:hypothetical protein